MPCKVLMIIGFKLPSQKLDFEKLCQATLLEMLNLSGSGKFRIVYFHSGSKGKNNRGQILIKKLCNAMTDSMLGNLQGIHIVHGNFALKSGLIFYSGLGWLKSYKLQSHSSLKSFLKYVSNFEETFIYDSVPLEIRLHDE